MTDEQIKQSAEEYVNNFILSEQEEENYKLTFIDGANSRDEEIEALRKLLFEKECDIQFLEHKLRNPWISVEDRLPENNCIVFVSLDGTEYLSAHYRAKSKRFVTVSKDKQTLIEVRKSAGTYTVCGDCIKEERLYSEGQREDITSLVTHWMLIPKLTKVE